MKHKDFHLTHYLKVKLTKDISLRYFISFQDRPNYVGKWFIKSHSRKEYAELSHKAALMVLEAHGKSLDNAKEIIGRYVDGTYRKIVVNLKKEKCKLSYEPNTTDKSVVKVEKEQ